MQVFFSSLRSYPKLCVWRIRVSVGLELILLGTHFRVLLLAYDLLTTAKLIKNKHVNFLIVNILALTDSQANVPVF